MKKREKLKKVINLTDVSLASDHLTVAATKAIEAAIAGSSKKSSKAINLNDTGSDNEPLLYQNCSGDVCCGTVRAVIDFSGNVTYTVICFTRGVKSIIYVN